MGQDGRVHLHLKQNVQSLTSHSYVSLSVATGIGIFLLILIVLFLIGYKMRRSKNKYVFTALQYGFP